MHTKILIAALFMLVKNWKLRRRPPMGQWQNKLWYMNIMDYYCMLRNPAGTSRMVIQRKLGRTQ